MIKRKAARRSSSSDRARGAPEEAAGGKERTSSETIKATGGRGEKSGPWWKHSSQNGMNVRVSSGPGVGD